MRTWTWANLLRCPPRERAPSQTAPRTPLIDAAAAGLIAHPAKDPEKKRSGAQSFSRAVGWLPGANGRAYRPPPPSGQRQPRRQRGESRPGTGAAASRLALAREIAASTGDAQQACPSAAARPGTTFRMRRSPRWHCGSCPGTRWIRPGSPTCWPGPGELPAHPDALLAVRLPAWPHMWQNRRTVADRHLLGDHRFHQHLGDVGGVAAEKYDPPAPQPQKCPRRSNAHPEKA